SIRTYNRFSDALMEVLEARIYGGMHYRHSTRIGANIGKQVSRFTTTHFFRRLTSPEQNQRVVSALPRATVGVGTATVPLSMRAAQVPAKIYPGEADDDSQARFRAPPGDEVPKGV